MKRPPVNEIVFARGSNTKAIKTTKSSMLASSEPNLVVVGANNIFQRGETKTEGIDRNYANGEVFPNVILSKGKNFEIKFYAYGKSLEAINALLSFQDFLWSGKLDVTVQGIGTIESCIPESITIEEEASFTENKNIIQFSIVFKSQNSTFS